MCKTPKIAPIRPRGSRNVYPLIRPCGECYECLASARAEAALRIYSEDMHAKSSFFVTLTYTDENLPFYGLSRVERRRELNKIEGAQPYFDMYGKFVLRKDDATMFFYSLHDFVKKYDSTKLARYVINGEYSPYSHRPHMHALVFLPFEISEDDFNEFLLKIWRFGQIDVGDVEAASINYLGKHSMKEDRGNDYIQQKVSPIFQKRSVKNGGIGIWLKDDPTVIANYNLGTNSTQYGDYIVNIPRYVKKKLHPETMSEDEIRQLSRQSYVNLASRLFQEFGVNPENVIDELMYHYNDLHDVLDTSWGSERFNYPPEFSNVVTLYRYYNYGDNLRQLVTYFQNKFNKSLNDLVEIGYFQKNLTKKTTN